MALKIKIAGNLGVQYWIKYWDLYTDSTLKFLFLFGRQLLTSQNIIQLDNQTVEED